MMEWCSPCSIFLPFSVDYDIQVEEMLKKYPAIMKYIFCLHVSRQEAAQSQSVDGDQI